MVKKNDEVDIQSQLLLRELEEEHRRAQMAALWKKYSPLALGVAAAIIVGIGGFKLYQYNRLTQIEAAGARFETALRTAESGTPEEARKAFADLIETGRGGYAALAELQAAAAELRAGRQAEAVKLFEQLADDRAADPLLRDFAKLQAAVVRSATADWTEMQNRLNDLVVDGNAWRFSARELWGLSAMKAGKLDEARKSFEQLLGDRNTPPSIGQRAQIMMAQIVAAELGKSGGAPAKKE